MIVIIHCAIIAADLRGNCFVYLLEQGKVFIVLAVDKDN